MLEQQPPLPEAYGLSSASTVLQVWTEFVSPPSPAVSQSSIPSGTGSTLPDEFLDFGLMKIGPGKAFMIGQNPLSGIPVSKQWVTLEGRSFLVEQLTVAGIAPQLDQLPVPQQVSLKPVKGSPRHLVTSHPLLPAPKLAEADKSEMKVAEVETSMRGLVWDYQIYNYTNLTFKGDTTYSPSGGLYLYGTNTFEGGTVLKYATNAGLYFNQSTINCLGSAYRPVILTALDDNTVGRTISGSTGNPTNGAYANPALYFNNPQSQVIANLRIAYAQQALELYADHSPGLAFYNIQMVNCQNGVLVNTANASFYNALFENIGNCFDQCYSGGAIVQNGTFNDDRVFGGLEQRRGL